MSTRKAAQRRPASRPTKVMVIGLGKIGLCLLPTLCRFLNYGDLPRVEVHLIDGDEFEERDRERQDFTMLGPKASVVANEDHQKFPRLLFWDRPIFLADNNIVRMIREHDLVFVCVDNHKTRKLVVSDRAEALENVTVISGGNDYTDGNVQVDVRRDGKNLTLPLANKYHPEILNPQDTNPADEENLPGATRPQLLITNNAVAATMLNVFYGIQNGQHEKNPSEYGESYLDVLSGKVAARRRAV